MECLYNSCSNSVVLSVVCSLLTAIGTCLLNWIIKSRRDRLDRWAAYRTALQLWGSVHKLSGRHSIIDHFCVTVINNNESLHDFLKNYSIDNFLDFIKFLRKQDTSDGFSKWFDTHFKW